MNYYMEIEALRLIVSDRDLNEIADRFLSPHDAIRGLHIAVIPDGIRVSGKYQKVIGIPFETLWQVSASDGKICARFEKVRAGFLSLGIVKGYVLDAIAAATTRLQVKDQTVIFDVDALFQDHGWPLRTNLSSIRCHHGHLVLEGCHPGAGESISSV
jgi:hypothetical protein